MCEYSSNDHDVTCMCCRRKSLKRWKIRQDPQATYGNLLKLFLKAGQTQCVVAVCDVLKKKCEYVIIID